MGRADTFDVSALVCVGLLLPTVLAHSGNLTPVALWLTILVPDMISVALTTVVVGPCLLDIGPNGQLRESRQRTGHQENKAGRYLLHLRSLPPEMTANADSIKGSKDTGRLGTPYYGSGPADDEMPLVL